MIKKCSLYLMLLGLLLVGGNGTPLFVNAQTLAPAVFLPFIRQDPPPPPRPAPPSGAYQARLQITPTGGLNASTFSTGSFIVENLSAADVKITDVRINLATAVFRDMVFDPDGVAGDAVAKDIFVDASGGTDFRGWDYVGSHDDGYDAVDLEFSNFTPGKRFIFSVDVDPTTIRGVPAPGPGDSGSASGLELSGTTMTVTFEDGTVLTGQTSPLQGNLSMSIGHLWQQKPDTPAAEILGASSPSVVSDASQTVRVTGEAWQTAKIVVIEGALFTAGLPGGGHDVEPFETNSALAIRHYSAPINYLTNSVDIPIMLSRQLPEGGRNHIFVYLEDSYGVRGTAVTNLILELQNQ